MKVKASELEGVALDWAVARARGGDCGTLKSDKTKLAAKFGEQIFSDWNPSDNWSQGGPLIESFKVELERSLKIWTAIIDPVDVNQDISQQEGPTPLIAACRAIVAAKLGEVVDVPKELL